MAKQLKDSEVVNAIMAAKTKGEAAELLGVSRQTIYNYMNDEDFCAKLDMAIEERESFIAAARQSATMKAIEYLTHIIESPYPPEKEVSNFLEYDIDGTHTVGGEPVYSTAERLQAARILLTSPAVKTYSKTD